ncbi:MAG: type I-B CRISPR-associated protein Cas7/Csh2 [Fretibacterium sp.]|nr:type I-B CRISPR-associated protein Cas7/Csh2 [Fretibacterium sp.]
MSFDQRREYLFVYSVKDANPNGDPLNANHPRFDEDSRQILVSDVRVKRTVRDQWLREGQDVFVDGETKTLKSRVEELKAKLNVKTGREALAQCIDTRLFGVTFALGSESFSWTGPVQFKWGRSLHQATVQMIQGTAAFATKETSEQRSFRNEYIVPFVLIADYAIANQHASQTTGATDEDLEALFSALWRGTANLITRSKVGHMPRFLLEVRYNEGFDGITGALDEKIALTDKAGNAFSPNDQLALRSCGEVLLNVQMLAESVARLAQDITSVRVVTDPDLEVVGLDIMKSALGERFKLEAR